MTKTKTGVDQRLVVTDQHGDVVGGFAPTDATLSALPDTTSFKPYGERTSTH